jgi:adenylate cyclase
VTVHGWGDKHTPTGYEILGDHWYGMSSGVEQTFLFADLAGYTALTETHGDETAADLVGEFCASVRRLLPEHKGAEVKTIGDAMMIRTDGAAEAVALGLEIVDRFSRQHGFPIVRVGMHTGSAVERDGDWFGSTVNLAARVAGVASGGEVVLTAATREAAEQLPGVDFRARGRHELKNVAERVDLYRAVVKGAEDEAGLPIDPVCRMAVDSQHSAGRLVHAGVEYRFCSLECAGKFAAAPGRFIGRRSESSS